MNLLKDPKSADKSKKAVKKSTRLCNIAVFIKKNAKVTKFKIRRGRYFYTFQADKLNVIQAIENGLGKDVEKVEIKKRRVVAKKAKK